MLNKSICAKVSLCISKKADLTCQHLLNKMWTSSISRAGISKNEMRRHWTARKRGIRFPSRSCTDDGRVCQLCKVFSRRSLNSKCFDGHDVWYDMPRTPLPGGAQMPKPPQLSFFDVEDQQPSKISTDGKNLGVLNDQLFPE